METTLATSSAKRSNHYKPILLGGLIAGILDLTAAFISNGLRGATPLRVMHSVASGLLGAEAFRGGAKTAALGVLCHFIIATGASAVYYVASRKLNILVERPIICGLLYGVAVYCFTNFVILPLSAIPFKVSYAPGPLAIGMGIIMLCVGLPIALIVSRYRKQS